MEEKTLVISLIVVLLLIVILFIVIVFYSSETKTKKIYVRQNGKFVEKEKLTIENMVEIAANRNSSKNDLTSAIIKVSKEFIFPAKIKGRLPEGIKVYLNFVLLVSSHKHSDAKLIAFMDFELKKANSAYSTEIDIYENEGLRQRGNRI